MSKDNDKFPDFSGKCISLTIMDDSNSHDLWEPYFEYQGDRLFIVGIVPEGATSSNWVANCQGAVAWDRVTDYFIFNNLKAYTRALNISESHQKSKNDESGISI